MLVQNDRNEFPITSGPSRYIASSVLSMNVKDGPIDVEPFLGYSLSQLFSVSATKIPSNISFSITVLFQHFCHTIVQIVVLISAVMI